MNLKTLQKHFYYLIFWFGFPLNHINGIDLKCPHCSDGNVVLKLTATDNWKDRSRNSLIPQSIWDITWYIIALAGRLYTCSADIIPFWYVETDSDL